MSVKLMAAIWDHGPNNPTQRFVLLALADYADYDGSCFPSYNKTAERCAISRSTAVRTIKALEKEGWLTIENQMRDNGSYTSNRVYLNLERLLGGSTVTPPSSTVTPGWGQDDTRVVSERHQGSSTVTPLDPLSYPLIDPLDDPRVGRDGAIAPAPPPTAPFQPVPETVKRQKARHGVPEPVPSVTAAAPPAVVLLHRLTTYWPGADITDALAQRFGDAPDEVALARAVELWRLSGNKITNWLGIADWYDELRRDPSWTPQARFKPRPNGSGPSPKKTVSTPEPGSQPVNW